MDPLVLRLTLALAFTALVLQFLLSGIQKLANTRSCDDAKMMERVFGPHCPLNMAILLLAGVWEVVASLVVLGTTYFDTHVEWRRLALVSLVVFTVAATLLFKVWPKVKYYGLLANVSVAGGLALAATM